MTFDRCRRQFNFCNSDSFFSLNQRIIRPSVGSSPLPSAQARPDEPISIDAICQPKTVTPPPELPRKPGVIKILGKIKQSAVSEAASSANERKPLYYDRAAYEQRDQSSVRSTQDYKCGNTGSPMFEVTSDDN